jgi:hypothetical protein
LALARPRLKSSAAYRIALAGSAVFALAVMVLGAAVYYAAHNQFYRQFERQVSDDAQALAAEYHEDGLRGLRYAIDEREQGSAAKQFAYAVFDRTERRIAGSLAVAEPAPGWSDVDYRDSAQGIQRSRALAVDLGQGLRLVVAGKLSTVEEIDETVLFLFGGAFLAVALFGIAGALLLGGYLDRRLSGINDAARAIMQGDIGRRVPVGVQDDEFDRMAETLNAMLDRISGLMENLRQVSSDIAHDLRTPLARIRNQIEGNLLEPPETTGDYTAVLEDAIERIDEVLKLFSSILLIAAVEGGKIRASFVKVDLSALLTDLCESYGPAIEDSGRQLDWSIDPGIELAGDRELLAQAVINLLDNAQIHTQVGAVIRVELHDEADAITVVVTDNGPGIPEPDRQRALQRFVRLEASRSTPGHGLGMSLVKAIAEVHGAQLALGDAGPGLRVEIRFPKEAERKE